MTELQPNFINDIKHDKVTQVESSQKSGKQVGERSIQKVDQSLTPITPALRYEVPPFSDPS